MSELLLGTVTSMVGAVPPSSAPQTPRIKDDLDSTTEMPVDVWAPPGVPSVGDRVLYQVAGGLVVVLADLTAEGRWQAYTPTVTNPSTGAVLASSSATGKFTLLGNKTCAAQGSITITNASTAGAAVDLPFPGKNRDLNVGSLETFGGTTPSGQSNIAAMTADQARLVLVTNGFGFLATNAGNAIRWSAVYELA